jgi:hypothetical protein
VSNNERRSISGKPLPPDPDEMNGDRSDWAQTALVAFAVETGQCPDSDGFEEIATDLIADLMHFCDVEKIDFSRCLAIAQDHYREETTELADRRP